MNLGCKSEEREMDDMIVPSSHDKQLKYYPDNDCLEKLTPRLGIWALLGASAHTYLHPFETDSSLWQEMVSLWQPMASGSLEATVLWRSLKIISFPLLEYKEWPSCN